MRYVLLICASFFISILFSQEVNGVDGKGKKHGFYPVELDDQMCASNPGNGKKAYEVFVHGKEAFKLNCSKYKRELSVVTNLTADEWLTGTVDYYNTSEELIESQTYKNGKIQELIIYNRTSGSDYYWTEEFYFNKLYKEEWGSCYYLSKSNSGKTVSEGYFRDGESGWQLYESEIYQDTYMAVDGDSIVVVDIKPEEPKYPYLGYNVPPYIAATVGYEGIKFGTIEGGVSLNIAESYLPNKLGSMLGAQLLFRYNFATKDSVRYTSTEVNGSGDTILVYKYYVPDTSYWGLSLEFGKYSVISYGLGYNFNTDGHSTVHGIRPFIGTSLFNFQLLYSYNFLLNKNSIGRLTSSRITLRYIIPIAETRRRPKS